MSLSLLNISTLMSDRHLILQYVANQIPEPSPPNCSPLGFPNLSIQQLCPCAPAKILEFHLVSSFSYTLHPLTVPVCFSVQESNQFLLSLPLLPWSKPACPLTWIIAVASYCPCFHYCPLPPLLEISAWGIFLKERSNCVVSLSQILQ